MSLNDSRCRINIHSEQNRSNKKPFLSSFQTSQPREKLNTHSITRGPFFLNSIGPHTFPQRT